MSILMSYALTIADMYLVIFENVKKQTAEVVKTVREELNDQGPGPVEKDRTCALPMVVCSR